MKTRQLICALGLGVLVLPLLANAEIYKWKDKNGVMRYSDRPPPADVKLQQVDGKSAVNTGKPALAPVEAAPAAAGVAKTLDGKQPKGGKEDAAAKGDQTKADADKKTKEDNEKIAKIKEENCKTAKTNLANFQEGGRLYKVDEKGERHYMDDKDMKEGIDKSNKQIAENCS